jgi:hypothetical protein
MRALIGFGAFAVIITEAVSFVVTDRETALRWSGVALALVFVAGGWLLARRPGPSPVETSSDDSGTALSRWVERAESQIAWSESTRADWDRRLRPMLARQFERAARQPRSRNPAAFDSAGRVHFGDSLWKWVDPENISRTGTREDGPGRTVLTDILERLERL